MSKIDRLKVHEKCNGRCGYCGINITVKEMQVDHILAQERGGTDEFSNLMPSCRYCNKHKTSFMLEDFRFELSQQLNRANKYSSNYRMAKRYMQVTETPKPIIFYFETLNKLNK
jgi:5-methylcytosine-specific restriction endonuclease McrA